MSLIKSSGGGSVDVRDDCFFVDTTARDAFFVTNPGLLIADMYCVVNGTLQKYLSAAWIDVSATIRGEKGEKGDTGNAGASIVSVAFSSDDIVFTKDDAATIVLADARTELEGEQGIPGEEAPELILEYSIEPTGPWVDQTIYDTNPNLYQYWHWSTDDGETWSADGVRNRASVQELPDGWGWFADGNGGISLMNDSEIYLNITQDELTSERFNILNSILKFGASKAMYDAGENVVFHDRVSDTVVHPVWQKADLDGDWTANARKKGTEYTKLNYISYVEPDLTTSTAATVSISVVPDQRIYAFYINSVADYADCTITIKMLGCEKLVAEKLDVVAGENRIVFSETNDGQPFLDVYQGQVYSMTFTAASGEDMFFREELGTATAWWAIDTFTFTDKPLLDAESAGTGLTFNETTGLMDVHAGSTSELGGYKVGNGLAVDGNGTLYSTVSGSIVTVVADETARLALPQIAQAYTCIQTDVEMTYYLAANADPSVTGNWIEGSSTAASVVGFKGAKDSTPRVGVVEAETGDYTQEMIVTNNLATATTGFLFIDADGDIAFDDGV